MKPIMTVEDKQIPESMRKHLSGRPIEEQLQYFELFRTCNIRDAGHPEYHTKFNNPLIKIDMDHEDICQIITCDGIVVGLEVGFYDDTPGLLREKSKVYFDSPDGVVCCTGGRYGSHYHEFIDIYAKYILKYSAPAN